MEGFSNSNAFSPDIGRLWNMTVLENFRIDLEDIPMRQFWLLVLLKWFSIYSEELKPGEVKATGKRQVLF